MRHVAVGVLAALTLLQSLSAFQASSVGAREPSWSPDGKRVAVSLYDRVWTMAPDGKNARALTTDGQRTPDNGGTTNRATRAERDPAWSPDGASIAFAVDEGGGFDLFVAPSKGGAARRLTTIDGDERWPSWDRQGRIVFAHRVAGGSWDLKMVAVDGGAVQTLTETPDNDLQPRVSPDGLRVAFASDRDSEDGDVDLWTMALPKPAAEGAAPAAEQRRPTRVALIRGEDGFPSWSPAGDRLAFYAVREGLGSVWVAGVDAERGSVRARPAAQPVLVSRHGGAPAWSPDGRTILVAALPDPEPGYNGNPARDAGERVPAFDTAAFRLLAIAAPAVVDEGTRTIAIDASPGADEYARLFDRAWQTLADLYYTSGPAADEWRSIRDRLRPRALEVKTEAALEDLVDEMVASQPLIKPAVVSNRAVVTSGHPLASRAGALALERGGNIVDAAIAVSFALGVLEPDASGIGGDGMAVLYMKGMPAPVVIDYKDEAPLRATADNPKIFRDGRLVGDGAAAANIPGVVAGLDHLFRKYGSGKVKWADLIAPAIEYAEQGFILDAALPTTIAEGRQYFEKHAAARAIYLPDGKVPKPGSRFVNKDYGSTLRSIARGGADAFYRGDIARKIARDMTLNGGIIGLDDLAQYRAIERAPVAGRYRDHLVYSAPPPVSSGVSLVETLQILDHYKPAAGAHYANDADYFHYLIEAWKARDAIRRISDPERWDVDLGNHLERSHAAELFKRIDPRKASPRETTARRTGGPAGPVDRRPGRLRLDDAANRAGHHRLRRRRRRGQHDRGHADAEHVGRHVLRVRGLGFLYNNHLRGNRTAIGYGQMLPLQRSSSTSVPTILMKARRRDAAAPARGGVRGQCVDHGVGLQHHHERRRFRAAGAARD